MQETEEKRWAGTAKELLERRGCAHWRVDERWRSDDPESSGPQVLSEPQRHTRRGPDALRVAQRAVDTGRPSRSQCPRNAGHYAEEDHPGHGEPRPGERRRGRLRGSLQAHLRQAVR